jgi:CubicO group peptidase (beta-lactamase class C family)
MKNHRIPTAAACLFLTAGMAGAQESATPEVDLARRIEEAVRREVALGFSGAVFVQHSGIVLVDSGYGTAAGENLASTSRFRLGTLGDPFTAAAVMKCSEERSFTLDDTLARFIPEVPADKKTITIRQLLMHRSGLAPASPAKGPESRDAAVARVLARPLSAGIGQTLRYSGDNYLLAAAIVEIACKTDFASFLGSHLLEPAGLNGTGLIGANDEDDRSIVPTAGDRPARPAAGSWDQPRYFSTTGDLAVWYGAIRSGRLLSRAGVVEFIGSPEAPGLGGFVEADERGMPRVSSSSTEETGANGSVHVYPNSDTIIVVLTHAGDKSEGHRWSGVVHSGVERVLFP